MTHAAATKNRTRPQAAVVVACLALFTDMLVYGLAIPALPLLDATVDAGPLLIGMIGLAAATLLFALGGPYWA